MSGEEGDLANASGSQSQDSRGRVKKFFKKAWEKMSGSTISEDPEYPEFVDYSELEDLETPPRYRPDSLAALSRATRFTEPELKRIYRGFKAECPTGVVKEDTFKGIYSQFFPKGANTSQYAHYVFNSLDQDRSGLLSFEDFVHGLSILSRGSLDEKLRWTFSLYDINGDGRITREEMTDIVTAIYDLMGKFVEPSVEESTVAAKVDRIFQKMDRNRDGVVTLEEFLESCTSDEEISRSMSVFDSSF
ncbi:Kv channel-interacting protein 1 isoform X4 [Homalodisca vitripennis]|uniref:Kv channel-interacting protein 1 isoform X4 n=1 Tax=Homalodisca vitripennis TaxID=197043 RepID=UPI001EEB298F|nr:Kv channel-interacting protein 1 isoform X4 [Homalodisca vitripennis]